MSDELVDAIAEMRDEVTAWMKQNDDHGKVYAEPRLITVPQLRSLSRRV